MDCTSIVLFPPPSRYHKALSKVLSFTHSHTNGTVCGVTKSLHPVDYSTKQFWVFVPYFVLLHTTIIHYFKGCWMECAGHNLSTKSVLEWLDCAFDEFGWRETCSIHQPSCSLGSWHLCPLDLNSHMTVGITAKFATKKNAQLPI